MQLAADDLDGFRRFVILHGATMASGYVTRVLDEADELRIWVDDDRPRIRPAPRAFAMFARVDTADPPGWWLAYVWTAPEWRDHHLMVPLIRAGLTELDAEGVSPYLFRPARRDRAFRGGWGYLDAGRDFSFLGMSNRQGQTLYVADPLDLTWGKDMGS